MVPLGIPHSQFLGWSADDQDKALAYTVRERQRCQGCGTHPDTWVTIDGRPVVPPPYEPTTHVCQGCAERARYEASEDGSKEKGAYTVLVPADPTDYDEDQFTEPSKAEVLNYG